MLERAEEPVREPGAELKGYQEENIQEIIALRNRLVLLDAEELEQDHVSDT